ncbi:MAG: choice-of-anchor B family protein [Bacteroidia bacterium]
MGFSQSRGTILLQFKGRWDNDALRKDGTQTYNSLWGWAAPDGREYAIIGSLDSMYFIEVTNPEKPVLRDAEAGRYGRCIHREFKTYKNYCYAVADEGPSSLQIYDLKYLPDSVHKVYDNDTLTTRSHNLFIDNDKLYLADNKVIKIRNNLPPDVQFFTLSVASLADPENPVLLGHLEPAQVNDEYIHAEVHDLMVRNDTAYCSNGNYGLFIYNYAEPKNPKLIASIQPPYPQHGYNHSSWLSSDGNTMVFADENHAKELKIYNVSSLKTSKPDRLEFLTTMGSNANKGSIPHNPFIKDNLVYSSYYHDGVVVFDITDPKNPTWLARYDTYPQNDTMKDESMRYYSYEGCWNVYPFLPSGNVVASDMTNGLFVLRLDTVPVPDPPVFNDVKVVNNPFRDQLQLKIESSENSNWQFDLYDAAGHIIGTEKMLLPQGVHNILLYENASLSNGMYVLRVKNDQNTKTFKLIHL